MVGRHRNGPAELEPPGTRTTKGLSSWPPQSLAHPHPSTYESPHACLAGVVYIGHLVEEDGEEVEVFEAVPCRKCVAGEAGVICAG